MKKATIKEGTKRSFSISAFPIIILCFILAMVIYHFVYGNPTNFIIMTRIITRFKGICWVQFTRGVLLFRLSRLCCSRY